MTRSSHKIFTLCFLSLHALSTIACDIQPRRNDFSQSQDIRPSGTYFTKKPTMRNPKELSWQNTRDLGNNYLNELRYELKERHKDWTQTPTCPSEKKLEKKLCFDWQKTPRNHKVAQTEANTALCILNFITATDITKKFANKPCSAAEIQDTVTQEVKRYHPHFNRSKSPVVFAEWHTVARRTEEIAQRITSARTMVTTPPTTKRATIKTAR